MKSFSSKTQRKRKENLQFLISKCFRVFLISMILMHTFTAQQENQESKSPAISDVNILLPICKTQNIFNCREVYFKVKGRNGCFDWALEDESFIALRKIPSKIPGLEYCFDYAVISTKINSNPNTYTYLRGTDRLTGQKFNSKIGFAFISKISVYKRFTHMNTGEHLDLGVLAKDSNNNSFSSVEGLGFNWKIVNNTNTKNKESTLQVAELLKPSLEHHKDVSEFRMKVEKTRFSDIVHINGVSTGKVEVYAELVDNDYNVKSENKEIVIKESFEVEPSEVWLAPETKFEFGLNLILERHSETHHHGDQTEESTSYNNQDYSSTSESHEEGEAKEALPSNPSKGQILKQLFKSTSSGVTKKPIEKSKLKYYDFRVSSETCGKVSVKEERIEFQSPKEVCDTELSVTDTRLPDYNNASAKIHVVKPESLDLGFLEISEEKAISLVKFIREKALLTDILSYLNSNGILNSSNYKFSQKWSLLTERYYVVKNFLKYNDQFLLFNEAFVAFSIKGFEQVTTLKNTEIIQECFAHNFLIIKTLKATVGNEFLTVISSVKDPIETSVLKRVFIYDSIRIKNFGLPRFYLPFTSTTGTEKPQELRLIVQGGSGSYKLVSSDPKVLLIKENLIYAIGKGLSSVKAIDTVLDSNTASIDVEVRVPESAVSLEERQEILVNGDGILTTAVLHNSDFYMNSFNVESAFRRGSRGLFIFTNCTSLDLEPVPESSIDSKDFDFETSRDYRNESASSGSSTAWYNDAINWVRTIQGTPEAKRKLEKRLKQFSLYDESKFSQNSQILPEVESSNEKLPDSLKRLFSSYLSAEYLEYANYGFCSQMKVLSRAPGYMGFQRAVVKQSLSSQKQKHYEPSSTKLLMTLPFSPIKAEIQFFLPLNQITPRTSDLHTMKVLGKTSFDKEHIQTTVVISPNSEVTIEFANGIFPWNDSQGRGEAASYFKQELSYVEALSLKQYSAEATKHGSDDKLPSSLESIYKPMTDKNISYYFKTEALDSRKVKITCWNELHKDIIVRLKLFNEPSEFLINPKTTEAQFVFSCVEPKYFSMTLEDDYDKPEVLRLPQPKGIMYTRQINSTAIVRIYAFDDNLRIFSKHDGTIGALSTREEFSEAELTSTTDESTTGKEHSTGNLALNSERSLYCLRKKILVKSFLKQFPVEYTSKTLLRLSHSITISAVNQAYLTPKEVKLYFDEDNFFEFEIVNGSGHFSLGLSDPQIGRLEYFPNTDNRRLKFYPKSLGLVEVLLKDMNFSSSDIVSKSIVIVSDVRKIQVFAPHYLMIGNEIKALVKVYDKKGIPFSDEQVEKMDLKVKRSAYSEQGLRYIDTEEERELISKVNEDRESREHLSTEDIHGNEDAANTAKSIHSKKSWKQSSDSSREEDHTAEALLSKAHLNKVLVLNPKITSFIQLLGAFDGVQALSVVSNKNVESNVVFIQVFEKIEVFPPMLLLYPGAEFTLKLLGGPENEKSLTRQFTIDDSEIASISATTPRVLAKKIGSTQVNISLVFKADENQVYSTSEEREYYNSIKEYKICQVRVPLQVAFPERVEIEGANNRRIYVDSVVRLLAAFKLGDRSFTYGIGSVEFNWSVDNPHLAKFNTKTLLSPGGCREALPHTNEDYDYKAGRETVLGDSSKSTTGTVSIGLGGGRDITSLSTNSSRLVNEYSVGLHSTSSEVGSFLVAFNYGAVSIKLTAKIFYPEPYQDIRPNVFVAKKSVSIEDNVWVDVAEFYDKNPGKSSLYLLPFNVGHNLSPHKKEQNVNYSILKTTNFKDNIINLHKNGHVDTSLNSGLVNVLIEKTEKSGLTIPAVINVFVTNYHSIFAQRSYELLLIEAGKVRDLALTIQHESGLLFAEGYDNLGLIVMESNPRIAQAEIINNSTTLRISAFKPGETYIILFLKQTRRILDVFKVGVESTLTMPVELNLLLGSEVNLFGKDSKKHSFIENLDAQWVSMDPAIVEIKNNSVLQAVKEGTTKIAMETADGKKTLMQTIINVSSLNSINLELDNVPSYLTDKAEHKNFQHTYTFPFKYHVIEGGYFGSSSQLSSQKYLSDSQDKDCSAHDIKYNIATKCEVSKESSGFVSAETSADGRACIVKVRDQDSSTRDSDKPINIILKATSKSKNGVFNKENRIVLTYHPGFITKTKEILFLSDSDVTDYRVIIAKPHAKNDLSISTSIPQLLNIVRKDNDFIVSIPSQVTDSFETNITIHDNTINQSQVIKVSYEKRDSSSVLMFALSVLLLILLVVCVLLWFIGGSSENVVMDAKPQNSFTVSDVKKSRSNQGKLFETSKSF